MRTSDEKLLRAATDGRFSDLELPELYVQVQAMRAKMERESLSQVPFSKALAEWKGKVYQPIWNEMESSLKLKLASAGLERNMVFLAISTSALDNGFSDVHGAVADFVEERGTGVARALMHLLGLKKVQRSRGVAI